MIQSELDPKPMRLPLEIADKIISYLNPDPLIFTRLAAVSRYFYFIFTSDEMWKRIDCFGWKKDIFTKFLQISRPNFAEIKTAWAAQGWGQGDNFRDGYNPWNYVPGSDRNLFIQLGYLSGFRIPKKLYNNDRRAQFPKIITEEQIYRSEHFLRVAGGVNPHAIALAGMSTLRPNLSLVQHALTLFPQLIEWLPDEFILMYPDLTINALASGVSLQAATHGLYDLYNNDAYMLQAAQFTGTLWHIVDNDDENIDPLVRLKCGFYQHIASHYSPQELDQLWKRDVNTLYKDEALFEIGLKGCPRMLKYAAETIKDNYDLVLNACILDGSVFEYASTRLRADTFICVNAMRTYPMAIEHVTLELLGNIPFLVHIYNNQFGEQNVPENNDEGDAENNGVEEHH